MDLSIRVVQPVGVLDSTKAVLLRTEVNQYINIGAKTILVDLSNVSFMDSSGLGALVIALKTVRSSNGKLFICSVNDQIRMLFELTSMDRVFEIFPDREAFQQAMIQSAQVN